MSDLISRECAINAVALEIASMFDVTTYDGHEIAEHALSSLPSAEGGDAEMNEVKSPYMQYSPDGADLISRADAIDAVLAESRKVYTSEYANAERIIYEADAVEALSMLPSAETHDLRTETHGVCLESIGYMLGYEQGKADAFAQADTMSSTSLQSAEATCATCADRALCIMSAPDGNWKECKDYRPSAEAVQTQAEKCDECIHKWTHKDKMTCKECVSAEAVQGEWIIDGAYWQHCNKCGVAVNRFAVEQVKASEHENLHFCPNCGARMKGGDSE